MVWLNKSIFPNTIGCCQNNGHSIGYYNRVLMLGHITALIAYHRPAVVKTNRIGRCRGNKRFDGHHRVFLKSPLIMPVSVIQQFIGLFVQASTYAMRSEERRVARGSYSSS